MLNEVLPSYDRDSGDLLDERLKKLEGTIRPGNPRGGPSRPFGNGAPLSCKGADHASLRVCAPTDARRVGASRPLTACSITRQGRNCRPPGLSFGRSGPNSYTWLPCAAFSRLS